MRAPTAADLLGVWEGSAALAAAERADALLALALPEEPAADLPLGERESRLLELRELLFGFELDATADCPRCDETIEFSLSTDTLRAEHERHAAVAPELSAYGYVIRFRLPTAQDLAEAATEADLGSARGRLLERCVLSASIDGRKAPPATLPEPVVAELAERMAEADPLADVRLTLTCPACGHDSTASLDLATWLWSEIEAWARRTLRDVHSLATAYGWTEAEILALGPRRELYLDLVEG